MVLMVIHKLSVYPSHLTGMETEAHQYDFASRMVDLRLEVRTNSTICLQLCPTQVPNVPSPISATESPGSFIDNPVQSGAWVQIPTWQFPSCVTLGRNFLSLRFSKEGAEACVWGDQDMWVLTDGLRLALRVSRKPAP